VQQQVHYIRWRREWKTRVYIYIYIYDHTYPGRERQGTQYRDDDMWCDQKISHHRKKEKEKWSRMKIDTMILHRRKRKKQHTTWRWSL
jgi:hypothetical protein